MRFRLSSNWYNQNRSSFSSKTIKTTRTFTVQSGELWKRNPIVPVHACERRKRNGQFSIESVWTIGENGKALLWPRPCVHDKRKRMPENALQWTDGPSLPLSWKSWNLAREKQKTLDHPRHNIREKIYFRCEGWCLYKKSDLHNFDPPTCR